MQARPRIAWFAVAFLAGSVAVAPRATATCYDYTLSPRQIALLDTPGSAKDVAISGSHAYVADNSTSLQVVNISDPSAPAIIGTVSLAGTALALAVDGGFAYVGTSAGLEVVDLANAAAPVARGVIATTGTPADVAVAGTTAYVALGYTGYDVVDCSDPDSPVVTTTVTTHSASQISADGARLATVYDIRVDLYDLSAPLAPAHLGYAEAGGYDPSYETSSLTWPILLGDVVLTLNDYQTCNLVTYYCQSYSWARAYDFTTPSSPVEVATIPLEGLSDVLVKDGDRAYLNSNDGGLWILDVSNPVSPTVLHRVRAAETDGGAAIAQGPGGPLFLTCDAAAGVGVVDVAHPDRPSWVGNVVADVTTYNVARVGSWAYTLGYYYWWDGGVSGPIEHSELRTYDATDPDNPVQIDMKTTPTFTLWGQKLISVGEKLFFRVPNDRLYRSTVDPITGIPSTPVQIASVSPSFYDIAPAGSYILVAQGSSGLTVLDPSPAGDPVVVTNLPTHSAKHVAADGPVAVTIDGATLRTVDFTVPTAPTYAGNLTTAISGSWVEVRGGLAAIGANQSVQLFDVSDPGAPTAYPPFVPGFDVSKAGAIDGDILYLSLGNGGLMAVDISDPSAPLVAGTLATDPAQGVLVGSGSIWIAEGGSLAALPPTCGLSGLDSPAVAAGLGSFLTVAPNPFRESTTIRYAAGRGGPVGLRLYDVQGRLVRRLDVPPGWSGSGALGWDGRDDAGRPVAPGFYFVRMETREGVDTAKLVRLR